MFKHIAIPSALAGAMLLSTGAVQAALQDIAVNGGFETGDFTGWTQFPGPNTGTRAITSPGSFVPTGPAAPGGDYALNSVVPVLQAGDPAVDNVIKNANLAAGLLTPGASITVEWDMYGSLTGAGGVIFIELFSELAGGGTSKAEIFGGGPTNPNTGWTHYIWNTTLGPNVDGGVTLQLKTSCGPIEGCGVDAFFDRISITTDVSAVPVPAAVWLFGSGLLGLVGIARRKKAA
ncbi:MAG: VPLPA-CTERM sorting domain-containing protein [Gammaproteobacteria bacterium]